MNRMTVLIAIGLFFAGIGLIALGIYQINVLASDLEAKADAIEALPYQSNVVLDMPLGTEVMLTGVAQAGSTPADSDPDLTRRAAALGLVAYDVERWTVTSESYDDRVEYRGRWTLLRRVHAPIALDASGTVVTIPPANLALEAAAHSDIRDQGQEYTEPLSDCFDCESAPIHDGAVYEGRTLLDGSLRVRGYAVGDTLTVVGTLTERTTIQPTRIVGGTRQTMLDRFQSDASGARLGGHVALGIGGVLLIAWIASLLVLREQHTKAQQQRRRAAARTHSPA